MIDSPEGEGKKVIPQAQKGAANLNLPALLVIMDGYGLAPAGPGNAIAQADTPYLDGLFARCPNVQLAASGQAVGLPEGQMGNSEVGHLNIGAGRVVHQELSRINRACADGSLAANAAVVRTMQAASKSGAVLHLMGLLSDGGVHSSNEHLYKLMEIAVDAGVPQVHVHCFMDGRDVPPSSGRGYIDELQAHIDALSGRKTELRIASISGRYYAMDRDNRWDRIEKAWRAMVACDPRADDEPAGFMEQSYADGATDEFVVPASFTDRGIESRDSVIFFNFRPDRARQITRAFTDAQFDHFSRVPEALPHFLCLTEYDPDIHADVAFPKEFPEEVLADVVSQAGLRQYHIAETEKYAHVTFFLNGGREQEKTGENRMLVPSPKVATYDLQPQMSEPQVAADLQAAIQNDAADIYIVNFANCDMVGHTGKIDAAVRAVEAVDAGVSKVVEAIRAKGGCALITADHGNADKMIGEDGQPFTAHSTNPVPLILVADAECGWKLAARDDAALCDIAPTLLDMIGLSKPDVMTGTSLLVKEHSQAL